MAVSCVHATGLPTTPAQVEQCEMTDSIRSSVECKDLKNKTRQWSCFRGADGKDLDGFLPQSRDFHVNYSKMTLQPHVEVRKWTSGAVGSPRDLLTGTLNPPRSISWSPHFSNWQRSRSCLCKYHPAVRPAVIWLSHWLFEPIGCLAESSGGPAAAFMEELICQDHSACVKGANVYLVTSSHGIVPTGCL